MDSQSCFGEGRSKWSRDGAVRRRIEFLWIECLLQLDRRLCQWPSVPVSEFKKNGIRMGKHPIFLLTSSVLACITTARAPTFGSCTASTIVTLMPAAANAKAQSKPTGPAPTIRTWVVFSMLTVSYGLDRLLITLILVWCETVCPSKSNAPPTSYVMLTFIL